MFILRRQHNTLPNSQFSRQNKQASQQRSSSSSMCGTLMEDSRVHRRSLLTVPLSRRSHLVLRGEKSVPSSSWTLFKMLSFQIIDPLCLKCLVRLAIVSLPKRHSHSFCDASFLRCIGNRHTDEFTCKVTELLRIAFLHKSQSFHNLFLSYLPIMSLELMSSKFVIDRLTFGSFRVSFVI